MSAGFQPQIALSSRPMARETMLASTIKRQLLETLTTERNVNKSRGIRSGDVVSLQQRGGGERQQTATNHPAWGAWHQHLTASLSSNHCPSHYITLQLFYCSLSSLSSFSTCLLRTEIIPVNCHSDLHLLGKLFYCPSQHIQSFVIATLITHINVEKFSHTLII